MSIFEQAIKGKPLSGLNIIDAHAHLGPTGVFQIPGDPSENGMVKLMDHIGIKKCLSSACLSIGPDYRLGNELVYQAMKKFPQRISGLCVVNPNYPDEMNGELELRFGQGFAGIKIHPDLHMYKVDGAGYKPVWEFALAKKLSVLSHTWSEGSLFSEPRYFDGIAKAYPQLKIILGHSGGSFKGYQDSIELAKKHENVFMEICGYQFSYIWMEKIIEKISADKVLFGTDSPYLDPRYPLGRVIFSPIPDSAKEKILGLNIEKILKS